MISEYRTIQSKSEGNFKDRGSKFFAFAYPVENEEEIKEILEATKKEFHDARHHCYAWKLGTTDFNVRANDDGEPSSSAGKPILNQIEKRDLTNILIIVVRYFGGTLLGVGGLINAYRNAASDSLEHARIIKRFIKNIYRVEFEYPQMNDVMSIIKEYDLSASEQVFELNCSLKLEVKLEIAEQLENKFKSIENCKINRL